MLTFSRLLYLHGQAQRSVRPTKHAADLLGRVYRLFLLLWPVKQHEAAVRYHQEKKSRQVLTSKESFFGLFRALEAQVYTL